MVGSFSNFYDSSFSNLMNYVGSIKKYKDSSVLLISPISGNVLSVNVFGSSPFIFSVDLIFKKNIEIGDKVSGRYGNKGVVSKVLSNEDMPYSLDGFVLDVIFNPLGIPSRMNIGQVFECLLGLVAKILVENYLVNPFDEIYGFGTSKYLVANKLFESKMITGKSWLFSFSSFGKFYLFDGRNGECFSFKVCFGYSYVLKLIHLSSSKLYARSFSSYSFLTQQPTKGKRNNGGQKLGEMEFWALEGFGSSFLLQEGDNFGFYLFICL